MQKITPCLWFDSQAEEAANLYVSIFKNSKILGTTFYTKSSEEDSGKPAGSVLTVEFELDGMAFTALNGGPIFKLSEAVSFQISCEDQAEVDYFWEKLTADGGEESVCGWLKDKFGLSWQVVPTALPRLLADPDEGVRERVMGAMMKMKKIDVAELEAAATGA
jgi:predicted 3-demethylubiquinone-9 3-methyltransferase (glyoxalase superfamily)